MRWQTTAALALLLMALGAFYYVYEIRWAPEREQAASRKGRVFTVEPADVTELVLKRGDEVVRLKREGDGWQMLEPVSYRGERGPVDETLTAIATARMDREIAAQPANPGDFGLDKPTAEATLLLKDGKQLGLQLGAKNPTGIWVYARELDKPNVFVVSDSVLRDVARPAADFRSKTILAFDRNSVSQLEIATGDETLVLEPAGEHAWKLTRPRALSADTDTVTDFLDKLTSARVKEFVAETPASLEPYGLERPVRVAVHTGRDKDRAVKTLLIGGGDDKKKGVYAMRPGEPSVLLLPEDVWTAMPKTTAAVRNKAVVDFDRDKLTRLELDSPHGHIMFVREKDRWRITQPEALPADQIEVGGVLMKLKGLKAQAFLTEDESGIARYLPAPEVRATFTQAGGAGPVTVLLAPSPEKRGNQTTAYAAVAGRGPVVLVDGSVLPEIGRSLNDLRDRTLVSGLDPKDVKRVQVRREGKMILLERASDAEWDVLEGGKGTAKTAKVDDLLWTLRALKWKELVTATGDPAAYGLDAPRLEVGLFRPDGTEIVTVQLGKQEGGRLYLKTRVSPAIYVVDPKQLTIPKVPDDFVG